MPRSSSNLFSILFVMLIAACSQPDPPQALHVYLLAGQSNMAGRGEMSAADTTTDRRIMALRADMTWGPAREPVHFDKPELLGVGPALSFARRMAEANPGAVIGLVPAAVGGSAIGEWVPGAHHRYLTDLHPYDDAVGRVSMVLRDQGGELKGIIWHQGEADRERDPDDYINDLAALVERFRTEFDDPDLPFVAGEVGYFFVEREPGAGRINEAILGLPTRVEGTAVVSAEGLSHKGDSVHFDAASARMLGERYADAMLDLTQRSTRLR